MYVGQTSRGPDWRFDQHKSGYKASSVVRKYGISLLPKLYEHLNSMLGWGSLELEAGLAEAFINEAFLGVKAATDRSACPFGSDEPKRDRSRKKIYERQETGSVRPLRAVKNWRSAVGILQPCRHICILLHLA